MVERYLQTDNQWELDIYNIPIYSVTDASRYLNIPLPTIRTWLNGRKYKTRKGEQNFLPLIQRPSEEMSQLSFTNLVEAHILRVIRTIHNISLDQVRIALDYISKRFDTDHPLATKQFSTDGVDLFLEEVRDLVNVSRSGQLAMKEILLQLLTRVEWDENNLATRLYPELDNTNDDKILIIDPRISFGKPVIKGTGVPTKAIAQLYDAGDSIEDIAENYDCKVIDIKQAILFESYIKVA
ncbi:DUF433 domain-containing protein [Cyanobacterium aponinum]|uniref:Putative antitoxin VapB45-like DNA-binding HTH domain-containing protein n=1 Tax=Cyanobacterium aponinum (strain PCC 10605) TaxID=755178 RepID=K9Z2Y4_CYAAP|nr:DUF433 domain-containing protein [Cyanobacterium aponinum]AFZ53087.1 protein of unknown function DUF433 [Cyanobacterium aponinum PCC 10605]